MARGMPVWNSILAIIREFMNCLPITGIGLKIWLLKKLLVWRLVLWTCCRRVIVSQAQKSSSK
jgi:hypothetical protein